MQIDSAQGYSTKQIQFYCVQHLQSTITGYCDTKPKLTLLEYPSSFSMKFLKEASQAGQNLCIKLNLTEKRKQLLILKMRGESFREIVCVVFNHIQVLLNTSCILFLNTQYIRSGGVQDTVNFSLLWRRAPSYSKLGDVMLLTGPGCGRAEK